MLADDELWSMREAYFGAFLQGLSDIEVQVVVDTAFDEGYNIHSLKDVDHDPWIC